MPDAHVNLDERITRLIESRSDAITDPYPLYDDLLQRSPVHEWGPTFVVSRYDDVKAVLRNSDTLSNRAYSVGSRAEAIRSRLSESEIAAFDEISSFEAMYISRADGAQHARLREVAHRVFTPRKMAELADLAQRYADELIEEMLGAGETDFMEAFASRLPTMMINSLLDVPLEDVELIKGWTARMGKNRGGTVTADMLDAHQALREFREYVADIVEHHKESPTTTALVAALTSAASEGRLTTDELLATMVVLIFAGSDTTTALLGNGLHALLLHRDQWDLVVSNPDAHLDGAIEELIRYVSPVQTTWRVTTQSTEIGTVMVPENKTVLVLIGAANRDPNVFDEPHHLQVKRQPNPHLAFGFGPHFCLGLSLARLEAKTVFRSLSERFPNIQLIGDRDKDEWQGNIQFRTIASLDVDFGRAGAVL